MNLILCKLFRNRLFLYFILMFLSAVFTVTSDAGCLAVRNETTQELYRTTVQIELLPYADRLRLAKGIICENTTELARVLENFY